MRHVLLTGVSRGVGLKIAKTLISDGLKVIGICRKETEELNRLCADHKEAISVHYFDLNQVENIESELFNSALDLDVPIHGFINNAAMAYDDIITNLDTSRLKKMYNVNVFAPMVLAKLVIRNMLLHRTRGSIVHLSSISAHTGYKGLAMYASTKGALEAFSKNCAREWGSRGIRSNCITAGFMETDMSAELTVEMKDRIYKRTALKQATELSSVAETALFLISDKSSSITGQAVFVDSGTI